MYSITIHTISGEDQKEMPLLKEEDLAFMIDLKLKEWDLDMDGYISWAELMKSFGRYNNNNIKYED